MCVKVVKDELHYRVLSGWSFEDKDEAKIDF